MNRAPIKTSKQSVTFLKKTKANRLPTEGEIARFRNSLLQSKWKIRDDVVSTSPAKQLFVTTQSLLNKDRLPYMEQLNEGSRYYEKTKNINNVFKLGDKLPPGYSLAYCNPLSSEDELSIDGYDNYHAPVINDNIEFFKRRMWVGGSFVYNRNNPLRFGERLHFTETVQRLRTLSKGSLIFADHKRSFENDAGVSITENRSLCYLASTYERKTIQTSQSFPVPGESISFTPSLISSFRMSAITFNSHQIHYNPIYAREEEKYTGVVVEAPLLISVALQFWFNSPQGPISSIRSFKYKIVSPNFVDDKITMHMRRDSNTVRIWMLKEDSSVTFDSTLQL